MCISKIWQLTLCYRFRANSNLNTKYIGTLVCLEFACLKFRTKLVSFLLNYRYLCSGPLFIRTQYTALCISTHDHQEKPLQIQKCQRHTKWHVIQKACHTRSGSDIVQKLHWPKLNWLKHILLLLSLIHIWRCRRIERCRSRWSPYH